MDDIKWQVVITGQDLGGLLSRYSNWVLQYMGGSLLYLWGTMQGRKHGEGKSMPEMGLQSLGQGSWIRAQNGEGWAGSRCGVPKMG